MSNRDPFPSPRVENDLTLSGYRPQQKKTYNKPTHIAQTEEPWSRLHDTATVASTQRSILNCTQTPNDSLDLQLNAVYDHHKNCFWSKNQILYQKETVSEDHRKEANLEMDEAENGITVWVDKQRRSIRIS
ncbi:cilia- and flagella-associated protein 276 [Pelmatolapia mariae]|uniref:cilia- and flagella-associated protein 276 n=1 Tax=Pelmatolapia mariae TaxID=158779 RepID=UPI002FE65AC2